MAELDRYAYSGHSVLMGKVKRPWRDAVRVLGMFGPTPSATVRSPGPWIESAQLLRYHQSHPGKRAVTFPSRVRRYVLPHADFDEDDTQWLCTTISAFLVTVEKALSGWR